MTIPRMAAITAYHKQHPPIHIMIESYLGIGKSSSETDSSGQSLFDLAPRTPT